MAKGGGTVLDDIEELLNEESPALALLEETLTEGYAKALALDAERLRLERRIGAIAREARTDSGGELSSLGRRLTVTDGELAKLRSLLATLNERARTARDRSV